MFMEVQGFLISYYFIYSTVKEAGKIKALRGMYELHLDSSMKYVSEKVSTKTPARWDQRCLETKATNENPCVLGISPENMNMLEKV